MLRLIIGATPIFISSRSENNAIYLSLKTTFGLLFIIYLNDSLGLISFKKDIPIIGSYYLMALLSNSTDERLKSP